VNKVEIIYVNGMWYVLNGAGEVVCERNGEYSRDDLPRDVRESVVKAMGLWEE